ncbi:hypothetical protein Sps_01719 [Shewanella psychrophila]|uniref:Uncharacterized protein n=1 Tax=Shewanella psychrophila TaxID=225848 RepID=A0A1S6HMY2_9GAMM|nr:hypothetical protein [Shewanella psychrophila]AQS36883.1 hypothetical protein Sps_01719 [Shewanella psychrophila]
MNKIKLIGLLALFATTAASANETIVFPGSTSTSAVEASITFPQEKSPIALVGGYQVEGGILTSRTYNCGINISDLEIEAKLHWDGATPQILIVGENLIMCRSGSTGPFSVDLTEFITNMPAHILDRIEVANGVRLGL